MIVLTIFDYHAHPPKPLATLIDDTYYNLYIKGTGKSLYNINKDLKEISSKIELNDGPVLINDPKSHIRAFSLKAFPHLHQINLSAPGLPSIKTERFLRAIASKTPQPEKWRQLLGESSAAYIQMEEKPLFVDEVRVYPRYTLDTFSGRSKCSNFNAQGAPATIPLKTDNPDDFYVCLDWVAADIRVAAALSQDEMLNDSFKESDPHTMLSEALEMPRDECKKLYLRTIYSLDLESPILELFPNLKEWMIKQLDTLGKQGYLTTHLGRRFKLGSRETKSVFNAVLQGTVAHAMHRSLIRTARLWRFLVTETHDSIVFAANQAMIPFVVREAVKVMIEPLENFPRFPLRVYIGKYWKKWKLLREYK
jgi:DNA polymerase I-like protein with 3'-5' exonuclease and polymerase domains